MLNGIILVLTLLHILAAFRCFRLEEIEDEFFTCVDPAVSAETLQMHPFIISTLYEYWKLKRKVMQLKLLKFVRRPKNCFRL